jgi:hypothetical protein
MKDCENCKNGAGLKPIKVAHRRSGHLATISLCRKCLTSPNAACWLRWRPINDEVKGENA